ncbi:uncharacterized protein LOC121545711 [Coregonus clupeaformis]|uniref:uncharacterized protein LOC121545711 n=1 Tax=Coregonus clupeaformis TaxID=59861 RepID=UPI001BDFB06F|nr:uncharacterized protein LOC121545711 [Coregonus clupeaformis]
MQYGPAELQSSVEEIRVMHLPFTTVVSLLAVFTVAFGAPVNQPVGIIWNNVTEGSLKLNELAKILLTEELSHLKTVERVVKGPRVLVESTDKCDPKNLRADSKPCLEKMVSALKNYCTVFGIISQFKNNCAEVGKKVNTVVKELLFELKEPHPYSEENWPEVERWEEPGLCRDNIEKLFSFSILMARVFAPGDPATHIMD